VALFCSKFTVPCLAILGGGMTERQELFGTRPRHETPWFKERYLKKPAIEYAENAGIDTDPEGEGDH